MYAYWLSKVFNTCEKDYELKQDLLKWHSPPDAEQLPMLNQQLPQPTLLNHPRKATLAVQLLFTRIFLYFYIVEQTTLPTEEFFFERCMPQGTGLHHCKHYSATISKPKFTPLTNLLLERICFDLFRCTNVCKQKYRTLGRKQYQLVVSLSPWHKSFRWRLDVMTALYHILFDDLLEESRQIHASAHWLVPISFRGHQQ
jgi:hypothetical protein